MHISRIYNLKIACSVSEWNSVLLHGTVFSFKTIRGLEEKRNKMCVLDMDEKGDLYLYKFALLCKNEIIKRLINGSYHLGESGDVPSAIGNSLIRLF